MFWLEEGLPSSLVPRRRPRTTLSPSLALRDGRPVPRVRHAGGRPAGPVDAARLPPPRRLRRQPSGRDRRAELPHRPLSRRRSTRGRRRRARSRSRPGGAAAVADDLRRRGHDVEVDRPVVARPRQRGLPRAPTACCEPAPTRAACRATPPAVEQRRAQLVYRATIEGAPMATEHTLDGTQIHHDWDRSREPVLVDPSGRRRPFRAADHGRGAGRGDVVDRRRGVGLRDHLQPRGPDLRRRRVTGRHARGRGPRASPGRVGLDDRDPGARSAGGRFSGAVPQDRST